MQENKKRPLVTKFLSPENRNKFGWNVIYFICTLILIGIGASFTSMNKNANLGAEAKKENEEIHPKFIQACDQIISISNDLKVDRAAQHMKDSVTTVWFMRIDKKLDNIK